MKSRVLFNGKLVPSTKVLRGRPILRTAEQWHLRGVECRREYRARFLLTLVPTLFATWLVMELLLTGAFDFTFGIVFVTQMVMYPIMYYCIDAYFSSKEIGRTHYSGLFEHGLQSRIFLNDMCFFIPYREVLDFQVTEKWFGQRLVLVIVGWNKPMHLDLLAPILGEDGLAELRRRTTPLYALSEPPRLVIYGDRSVPSRAPLELGRNIGWAAPRL